MKSDNMLIKCFITYINNKAKTPRFSGFITNDQYITVQSIYLAIHLLSVYSNFLLNMHKPVNAVLSYLTSY